MGSDEPRGSSCRAGLRTVSSSGAAWPEPLAAVVAGAGSRGLAAPEVVEIEEMPMWLILARFYLAAQPGAEGALGELMVRSNHALRR